MDNKQNKTLETISSLSNKNKINLETPQINQSNIYINPIINNENIPNIQKNSNNIVNNQNSVPEKGKIEHKKCYMEFGTEPIKIFCPWCEVPVETNVRKRINKKALCLAITLCFFGFMCIQKYNNKSIGCYDYVHLCPRDGYIMGTYYAI